MRARLAADADCRRCCVFGAVRNTCMLVPSPHTKKKTKPRYRFYVPWKALLHGNNQQSSPGVLVGTFSFERLPRVPCCAAKMGVRKEGSGKSHSKTSVRGTNPNLVRLLLEHALVILGGPTWQCNFSTYMMIGHGGMAVAFEKHGTRLIGIRGTDQCATFYHCSYCLYLRRSGLFRQFGA